MFDLHPRPCVDCHACAPPLQTNENRLQMSVGGQLLQPTSYESMQFESIVVSNIARQSMSFSDADPSAESVELYISEVRAGNRGGERGWQLLRGAVYFVALRWCVLNGSPPRRPLSPQTPNPQPLLTHTRRAVGLKESAAKGWWTRHAPCKLRIGGGPRQGCQEAVSGHHRSQRTHCFVL